MSVTAKASYSYLTLKCRQYMYVCHSAGEPENDSKLHLYRLYMYLSTGVLQVFIPIYMYMFM